MRSRLSSDTLLLGGLLVVTLVIALFAVRSSGRAEQEADFPARRTTYSPNRGGFQAVFETMSRLGYPVKRWRYSLDTLTDPGTLIVASPEQPVSEGEWQGLVKWVRRGNLLIYLVDEGDVLGRVTALEELFNPPRRTSRPAQPCPPAAVAPELRTRAAFFLDQAEEAPPERSREARPRRLRRRVEAPNLGFSSLLPLYRDDRGATVAYTNWGRGVVIVSSSPWSLSTVGVGQADNFAWLLATIGAYGPAEETGGRGDGGTGRRRDGATDKVKSSTAIALAGSPRLPVPPSPRPPATVWFDEYHHGFGQTRSVLSLMAPVARLGLVQVAVAWLLLTYSVSRRFGGRVPDEGRVRRSRSEYLSGMASLLRRARAVDLAVSQVRRQFMTDATRALGLPQDAAEPALLAAAATRGVDPERLRSLLERAGRVIQERDRTRQDEALAVARELAQVRSQLRGERSAGRDETTSAVASHPSLGGDPTHD